MKPSKLSLLDLTFLCARVELNPKYEGTAAGFDFDGSMLHWGVRHGKRDETSEWWVGVEFATEDQDKTNCPYIIEMKAVALFNVSEQVPSDERERFIYESGSSLVYGAIREMVSTITARSAYGALMLPTASFFGSFDERPQEDKTVENKDDSAKGQKES